MCSLPRTAARINSSLARSCAAFVYDTALWYVAAPTLHRGCAQLITCSLDQDRDTGLRLSLPDLCSIVALHYVTLRSLIGPCEKLREGEEGLCQIASEPINARFCRARVGGRKPYRARTCTIRFRYAVVPLAIVSAAAVYPDGLACHSDTTPSRRSLVSHVLISCRSLPPSCCACRRFRRNTACPLHHSSLCLLSVGPLRSLTQVSSR